MTPKQELELIERQTEQVREVCAFIEAKACPCGRPMANGGPFCWRNYREQAECHIRIAKQILAAQGREFI